MTEAIAAAKDASHPTAIAALLALTAGFVDTVGFIALSGLFTAHVTGNFVLIGAAFVEGHGGILGKLLALPVFVLAVAATRVFILVRERRGRDAAMPVLVGELLFLLLFLGCGMALAPFAHGDAPTTILTGMCAVIAMAIQNAASRTLFASLAPTTVMTGNVTQIVIDLVDLAAGAAGLGAKARLGKMVPPVLTFTVGALAGALGYGAFGYLALIVPILAVVTILVLYRRA
jgi:uncharacterized membrane protein YoaK (UPF0700 family)